jgi:hypothetical protein
VGRVLIRLREAQRMKSLVNRAIWICAGLCWFGFALVPGRFLLQGLEATSGLNAFESMGSPVSEMIAFVQVTCLFIATGLCVIVGIGLCAYGLVANRTRPSPLLRQIVSE